MRINYWYSFDIWTSEFANEFPSHYTTVFPSRDIDSIVDDIKLWSKCIDYLPKVLNVINILVLSSCVATTITTIKSCFAFWISGIFCQIVIDTTSLGVHNSNTLAGHDFPKTIDFCLLIIIPSEWMNWNNNRKALLKQRYVYIEIPVIMGVFVFGVDIYLLLELWFSIFKLRLRLS